MSRSFGVPQTKMLVASSSYFAYKPVLARLQSIQSIPFESELVQGKQSKRQEYITIDDINSFKFLSSFPQVLRESVNKLDGAQFDAYCMALQRRVALVQGPPGTGKTLLGVAIARTILFVTKETILCLCYTNHALDSFLEDLIDVGIKDIVRVGGRSKNEKVKPYALQELSHSADKVVFSREENRRYAQLCEQIINAEEKISKLSKIFTFATGKNWWDTIRKYLEDFEHDSFTALNISEHQMKDEEGFERVGADGNAI